MAMNTRRSIPCPHCNRVFKDIHGLRSHVRASHAAKLRPSYEFCDDADINDEYEPRQFRAGCFEDDF